MNEQRAAIVGTGLIGRAWANVFARAGWRVTMWDPDAAQRGAAAGLVAQSLRDLAAHGLVSDPEAAAARLHVAATLAEAVRDAHYVQESGPEVQAVKAQTFAEMDAAAPAEAVLASSTSAIVASRFTEGLKGRMRCLVAHPVNPPHLVPVVEVCGAPWTDAAVKQRAIEVLRGVGQVPIDVRREIDGFVLNRLQVALLTEAFRLVQDGVVSPEDLDHTIADGLGLRWAFMGPFETIELNAPAGTADYCRRYVDWFRRYMADAPPASVWDDAQWQRAAAAWGRTPTPAQIADRSRWRDRRLAALVAHKRGQPGPGGA
ncbi:MAG: 3-hydroxyacyl-CoA dehydrogenase [Rubrivivax sp.]|nr:3-hydroxyacyl-CoA dehydrogenase [Rubrivivax sp.]